MTDRDTRRVLIGLGLMLAVFLAAIMVVRVDVPSQKPHRLILDALGCEGAWRLGWTPSVVEQGVCELETTATVGLVWITSGNSKIHTDHLVAVRDAE